MSALRSGLAPFALLLATVVVVVAYLQTRAMDVEQHNERLNLLLQLQVADAQLDRDVLRVTSFLLQQYDPLVVTERHIRNLLQRLEVALQDVGDGGVRQGLAAYTDTMEQKLLMQEGIKSHVALVRNGLHYLPLATTELHDHRRDIGDPVSALLNDLYRYNLFPSESQATRIERAIDELALFSDEADDTEQGLEEMERTLLHFRANLRLTGRLATLRQDYVDAPTNSLLQDLYRTYSALHAARSRRADTYTLTLLTLTLASFLALGITLRNLHATRASAERSWTQLRDAVESLSEAFALFSSDRRLVLHNRRYLELYPWLRGRLTAGVTTLPEVIAAHRAAGVFVRDPELPGDDRPGAGQPRPGGPRVHLEELTEGRWYRASDTITSAGETACVRIDISKRKQDEQQIRRQASFDALTGLPNRSLLFDRIEHALTSARRNGSGVALLFADLDRFKVVNDTMGHVAGDGLLQQVAARLASSVRDSDTVARFGGDEFVIILEDIESATDAAVVAQKIIARIGDCFRLMDCEVFVGITLGITLYPADAETAVALLRNADMAMYRAKDAGRNTYRFYTNEMDQAVQRRMEMERELRLALDGGQLSLLYQPIVQIAERRLVGAETLLRWQHPRLGSMPPALFIPLAEETGLIDEIGRWVLREACARLASWRAAGHDLCISVNLSSRQLSLGLCCTEVVDLIEASGLPPDKVTLEITEGLMLDSSAEVLRWFEVLHEHGVGLAVDDFGTGYSSLAYLKRFPMDTIKIDRSFVLGLPDSHEDASLVRAILSMARSLQIVVIAEGIENQAQADFLKGLGCEFGQGYFYSGPVPPGRIPEIKAELEDRDRLGR